jgi:hypothetical protein
MGKQRAAVAEFPDLHLRQDAAGTIAPSGNEKLKCRKTTRGNIDSSSRVAGLKPKSSPFEMVIESLTTMTSGSPTGGTQRP